MFVIIASDSTVEDTNWSGTGEFTSGEIEDYFIELDFTDNGAKPKLTIDCGSEKKYFKKNQNTLKFNCFIENWVLSLPPPGANLDWTLREDAQIGAVTVNNINSNCPGQNPPTTFGGIDLKANCNLPLLGKILPRLGMQREAVLGFEATKIGPLPSKWTATVSTPDPPAIITSTTITPGYGMSTIPIEFLEELIPLWIRDVAGWWADGKTTDREFATGIGFLIKEKVIQVQNIRMDPKGEIEIDENLRLPGWIKNNAKWWKENSISDNDFRSGIQFMLKEKIIQFTAPKETAISDNELIENDSDGDGINDNQDSCPSQPETVNGYEDSDGCPDTPPIESDTTPPAISVPSNTIIESSEELTPVTFNAVANDDVDGSITPICAPPSGSLFPVGITTVTCTATDSVGNIATQHVDVTVTRVE